MKTTLKLICQIVIIVVIAPMWIISTITTMVFDGFGILMDRLISKIDSM